jgi:hypothetical protein
MSVFQRGGNFLHRRLTKLYSDTKQSYETATVASKADAGQDPVLKALHGEFRYQKDRLLAWGLQWSDSSATPSPDVEIDQKLDQAGLGHVVALVMSDIQKLLIESEMIENPQHCYASKLNLASSPSIQSDSKAVAGQGDQVPDDIAKSQRLLVQLVECIDTLYTLSGSRRTAATDTASETQRALKERPTRDVLSSDSPTAVAPRDLRPVPGTDHQQIGEAVRRDKLFIQSSCITLAPDWKADSENPPPYEEVMPLERTRLFGTLDMSKLEDNDLSNPATGLAKTRSIIVEYVPAEPYRNDQNDNVYDNALSQARQIFERQSSPGISHVGTLPLLGYTVDLPNKRHGFVYEVPQKALQNPSVRSDLVVSNLRDVIPSRRSDTDSPSPNLEDRFRLAFNILLGILQLSTDRQIYRDIRSSNLVLLFHPSVELDSAKKYDLSSSDIRRPYLFHSPNVARETDSMHPTQRLMWESLYRHTRYDDEPEDRERYSASAFDVYSFGLILLEIGLWTPISRLWKPKYSRSTFASRIKSTYVPKLASRCGTAYMKVVQTCVNAPEFAEQPSTGTTDSETEQFWITCMIEIGRDLARCCAIDGAGPACEPDLEYFDRLNRERSSSESLGRHHSAAKELHRAGISRSTSAGINRTTADSVGPQPRILRKWNNVDIPQEHLDQWNNILMPKISKLLQKALGPSRESCSASLMMIGSSPQVAKTTICIQCTSVEKVRDILKKHLKCKSGWELLVLKGDVRRSGKTRNRKKRSGGNMSSLRQPSLPEKSAYQQRPRTGASIGAFRDNEHLPPVSYGGAILVDGKPYGMTVHHMLDAPSDEEEEEEEEEEEISDEDADLVQRSSAREMDELLPDMGLFGANTSPMPQCPDTLELSDDESDGSTIQPDYLDLDTGQGGFWFTADDEESATPDLEDDLESDWGSDGDAEEDDGFDDDDHVSVGDIEGIDPADEDDVYVTQPAIDDVDADVFPCLEDRDEEHLASFSLGYVHASSGIRRMMTGNYKHEVDWALIKIRDERLALPNQVCQLPAPAKKPRRGKNMASRSPLTTTDLHTITPARALPRLPVHCHGRSSGLQSGRISPALALVKFHGRASFSSSWIVEGGGIGVPGDSGAWIYDPCAGGLCGHVLAWGHQSQTAYMAPMELLFDDIQRRLGADTIGLPRASHSSQVSLSQQQQQQLTDSEYTDTDTTLHDGMGNLHLSISESTTAAEPEAEPEAEDPDPLSPHSHQPDSGRENLPFLKLPLFHLSDPTSFPANQPSPSPRPTNRSSPVREVHEPSVSDATSATRSVGDAAVAAATAAERSGVVLERIAA